MWSLWAGQQAIQPDPDFFTFCNMGGIFKTRLLLSRLNPFYLNRKIDVDVISMTRAFRFFRVIFIDVSFFLGKLI